MKTNKGLAPIVIVLIIIAVLAIGGVAYYAGKKSNLIKPIVKESSTQNILKEFISSIVFN